MVNRRAASALWASDIFFFLLITSIEDTTLLYYLKSHPLVLVQKFAQLDVWLICLSSAAPRPACLRASHLLFSSLRDTARF